MSSSAASDPARFYIGIDANVKPLEKPSMRATRKPSKGGLPNALFVHAAIEDIPRELDGIATEVNVNYPWGSLLGAVSRGEEWFTASLRRLCRRGACVKMVLSLDEVRDRSEIERLAIPPLSDDHLRNVLLPRYEAAGFEASDIRTGLSCVTDLTTTWAKRLSGRQNRKMVYIVLKAR